LASYDPSTPTNAGAVGREADEDEDEVSAMEEEFTMVAGPPPPQDRLVPASEMQMQFRGGPSETNRVGEARTSTLTWAGHKEEEGTCTMQKIMVPDWARSWKLTLQMSNKSGDKFD